MKNGIVIAGFAGVGKTTLAKKYSNVIDLESSTYKWDNSGLENVPIEKRKGRIRKQNKEWPNNYIFAIKEAIKNYDIVLAWIHPDVLEIYDENNIEYVLCFPSKSSLEIYRNRFINRGNSEDYIRRVIDTYDIRREKFKNKNKKEIILEGNETLEDYLINNNHTLILK